MMLFLNMLTGVKVLCIIWKHRLKSYISFKIQKKGKNEKENWSVLLFENVEGFFSCLKVWLSYLNNIL